MIKPITTTSPKEGMPDTRAYPLHFDRKKQQPAHIRPSYLSASSVKNYLSCSLRFYFEKVARIRKPTSVALHVGKVIHATLQSYNLAIWRETDSSTDIIKKAYDQHFNHIDEEDTPSTYADTFVREKAYQTAWRTIEAFLASPEAIQTQKPLGVEVMLQSQLPGLDVPVRGAIDLVQGNLVPVDYKSAASKPDLANAPFDHELQLVTYQMLIEEATGETPPTLELIYLVKTKTPHIMRINNPPATPKRKQRIIDLYNITLNGITNEHFHPQPGMQCSWCSFKQECMEWCQ